MKRIALSLLTIAAVLTMSVAATGAYFSDSQQITGNTFSTGTVELNKSWLKPITVAGLYPGSEQTDTFYVQYKGSVKGDLYFGFKQQSGGDVLGQDLQFKVEKTNADGSSPVDLTGWLVADYPYQHWINITPNGISQDEAAYYKVHVWMNETGLAQNLEQGKKALANIILYAVQQGGSAPTIIPNSFFTN